MQLVRDEVVDGLPRLRLDLAQIDLAEAGRLRKVEPARAEEEMMRHEDGSRLALRVVPVLEPGVDLLAAQLGQPGAIQPLDRDVHAPPRGEEEEIGEEQADAGEQQPRQVRLPARRGEAERAAPDAVGAHENDGRFRRRLQNVGQRPAPPSTSTPRRWMRPEGQRMKFSPLFRPSMTAWTAVSACSRPDAGLHVEVRHRQAVEQFHERPQERASVHAFVDHRPRLQRGPQRGQDERRVDVAGVVRQDQHGAFQTPNLLQAVNAQPVAQGEDAPGQAPEQVAEQCHGRSLTPHIGGIDWRISSRVARQPSRSHQALT